MGGICNIKRPLNTQLRHRVPHNFETFEIKVVLLGPTYNTSTAFQLSELGSRPQPLKEKVIFLGMGQDFNFTSKLYAGQISGSAHD